MAEKRKAKSDRLRSADQAAALEAEKRGIVVLARERKKLMTRQLGRKPVTKATYEVRFTIGGPKGYFSPRADEVLLLDLLDHIADYLREFHDVPSFKLESVEIDGEEIIG